MGTTSLEGAHELIQELAVVAKLVTAILGVEPAKLAHNELCIKLAHTFANKTLRDQTLEGALGNKEANFMPGIDPSGIGGIFHTKVSDGLDKRLNEVGEARTIHRVETEGLLVNRHFDLAIRILDEGILHEGVFGVLEGTLNGSEKILLNTSLITQRLDLLRASDEHEVTARTIAKELRREIIAHVVGESYEELVSDRLGGETATEVDSNLIVATSKHLAKGGIASFHNCLHAGKGEELRTNVSRVKGLHCILKIHLRNAVRIQNRVASLIQADDRTFATQGAELGGKLSLAVLGGRTSSITVVNGVGKGGSGKALASNHAVSNQGADFRARVICGCATFDKIGVGVVEREEANNIVPKS